MYYTRKQAREILGSKVARNGETSLKRKIMEGPMDEAAESMSGGSPRDHRQAREKLYMDLKQYDEHWLKAKEKMIDGHYPHEVSEVERAKSGSDAYNQFVEPFFEEVEE